MDHLPTPHIVVDTDDLAETRAVVADLDVTVVHPVDHLRSGPQSAADTVVIHGPDLAIAAARLGVDLA
jgi:hypothetical protein